MILKSKICGVSDSKTLNYIVNHENPPQFIGFIVNYPKSKRYVDSIKLKELINNDKKNCSYVAVLVDPNQNTLEKIKDLPFDYYQLYNCSVDKIQSIKRSYNKKIIVALTIENSEDVKNYKLYEEVSDIYIKSIKNLHAINCPSRLNSSAIDEFLIIFLVAAKARGISKFRDLGEMNKKESKRLDLAVKFLKLIGIKVDRFQDNINIHGQPNLNLSGDFEIKNFLKDHRIFFLSCITALTLGGKWKIYDKESINTSFPDFLKTLRIIGAKIN